MKKSKAALLCIVLTSSIFSNHLHSQVTIGSDIKPSGGAILDLKEQTADANNKTSNKGFILPRVALSENNKNELYPMYDITTGDYTKNKAKYKKDNVGLTVYNITKDRFFIPGLYSWNGTEWRRMDDTPVAEVETAISQLLCANASMVPNAYQKGVPFEGIVKIPYTGGTGGVYEAGTPSALKNGMRIQLLAGKLSFGAGEAMYRVYGTPSIASPEITKFDIEFLGKSCEISVGNPTTSVNLKNLTNDIPVTTPYSSSSEGSANQLTFEGGDIVIQEAGSYAFSLRLYGRISGSDETKRWPFYIYLQKNNKTTVVDAAEIDLAVVPTQGNKDFSYSITLGGVYDAGDKVIISMCKPTTGEAWTLRKGSSANSNVRTSLIYWKL